MSGDSGWVQECESEQEDLDLRMNTNTCDEYCYPEMDAHSEGCIKRGVR